MLRFNPHPRRLAILVTALLLAALPAASHADDRTAFAQVVQNYEAARLSLINDSTRGVAERGREIVATIEGLAEDFSAKRAGIDAAQSEEVRSLLPLLREAATALADASDLDVARDAFYDLSKALVRWRKAAVVEVPAVAYCPMAKRSWLQPEGDLGNPYYGQSMLTCGDVVSDPS